MREKGRHARKALLVLPLLFLAVVLLLVPQEYSAASQKRLSGAQAATSEQPAAEGNISTPQYINRQYVGFWPTDGISTSPLQLLPETCLEPNWLTESSAAPPWHMTVLHGTVNNIGREQVYDTACPGWCGHPGVGPSIRRGLTALNVSFDFQPTHDDRVRDVVYVHVGHDAVRQALAWKAAGRVKLVIVGPNVAGQDGQGICGNNPMLMDPNLDAFIIPSQSAALLAIRDCPWMRPKIRILANGVDEHFWQPRLPRSQRKKIVLYLKSGNSTFHDEIEAAVRAAGYTDIALLKYGKYTKDSKKQLLSQAKALVLVSAYESQGIAAAEAWAMDVPVLAWATFLSLKGPEWPDLPQASGWFNLWSSTSPYLTPATGAFWTTPEDLTHTLSHWDAWAEGVGVSPRAWVLKHMTDKIAANNLLRLIHCEWTKQPVLHD